MIPNYEKTIKDMLETTKAKNADYAVTEDPFRNFKMVEKLGITDVPRGILVRMSDKVSRIINLLDKEASVKDESINDTLIDLANYTIILKCYLESLGGKQ